VPQQEAPQLGVVLREELRVGQAQQRVMLLGEQEALRVQPRELGELEGPLQQEVPQVRVPALQLLVQPQELEFLQQGPELRGLLRRYRHPREPARRQPQRCRLRQPEFLQ
jgi:hypothetical protein